jgi:hypothetical protein
MNGAEWQYSGEMQPFVRVCDHELLEVFLCSSINRPTPSFAAGCIIRRSLPNENPHPWHPRDSPAPPAVVGPRLWFRRTWNDSMNIVGDGRLLGFNKGDWAFFIGGCLLSGALSLLT